MLGVSIIIAAYNCEKYIERCLESLFCQTFKNIEIIVCDDCSTDGTYSLLKKYAAQHRIILLKNEKNLGASYSRNRCLNVAKYEYVAIQDADDRSALDRIEKELSFLLNSTVDFVSSGVRYIYEDGCCIDKVNSICFPNKRDFLKNLPFCHASTLFKKSALLSVGGYRIAKETCRGQDYDLFMRLYADGFLGANIKDILYFYYCDINITQKKKYKYRFYESIIRKKGFKAMGIGIIRIPYIIKPLLIGLIPNFILVRIKRRK